MPGHSVRINQPELRRLLSARERGPVRQVLDQRVRRVAALAKKYAPVDSGELRDKVYGRVVHTGPTGTHGEVGSTADHALYVTKGTGIYGPKKRPIVAKPGKVFVFRSRQTGDLVFTTRIRGMRPNNYLQRAMHDGIAGR